MALHPDIEVELKVILTSGDWKPEDGEKRLSEAAGGKGLFAKEIERAMLDDEIDIAVHSMKDMDSHETPGLIVGAMLEREDPRDALLLNPDFMATHGLGNNDQILIKDLPAGTRVGTSSIRRACALKSINPDLVILPFRGNVGTRIDKLKAGKVDATLLAVAGLNRLNLKHEIHSIASTDDMIPAAAQGAVGVQCPADRDDILSIISHFNHQKTSFCVLAERAALKILDGTCHTPIGAHATLNGDKMSFALCVYDQDSDKRFMLQGTEKTTSKDQAIGVGTHIAKKLKETLPRGLLA